MGYWRNAAAGGTGSGPHNTRKQPCCYRFRAHLRCSLPHSFASNALSSRASVSMSHHDLPLRMLVTVAGAIPAASATAWPSGAAVPVWSLRRSGETRDLGRLLRVLVRLV